MSVLLLSVCQLFATAVMTAAVTSPCRAQSDIDRELLENLESDRVDESDKELFAPPKQPAQSEGEDKRKTPSPQNPLRNGRSGSAEQSGDELVKELLEELRRGEEAGRQATTNAAAGKPDAPAAAAQPENPLVDLARQMREVEERIAKVDSGPKTQDGQRRIIERLDAMIAEMKKSCCGGGKPGQEQKQGGTRERKNVEQAKKPSQDGKPGKSAAPSESTDLVAVQKPEPAGPADKEHIRTIMKRLWGELPKRDRERLLQYPVEQFLPEYEQMIEEYYKRLSEEENSR